MEKVDEALKNLKIIIEEFGEYCLQNRHVTEADTRINLIDRILDEVLFWPKQAIRREKHADSGCNSNCFMENWSNFIT